MFLSIEAQAQTGVRVQSFQSPTAASLGEVVETPATLNTGTPNISIPLYTLNHYGLNIPISLTYNASGQKADQFASWVGMGWNLNAGGVITRQVKGLPDDLEKGFYNQTTRKALDTLLTTFRNTFSGYVQFGTDAESEYLAEVVRGHLDSQPDVFYVNALGVNTKFVISLSGEVQTIPKSKIEIDLVQSTVSGTKIFEKIIITREDGVKLIFAAKEFTGPFEDPLHPGKRYVSSWYLSQVVPVNTDQTLDFYYSEGNINNHEYGSFYEEEVFNGETWTNNRGSKVQYIETLFLDSIKIGSNILEFETSSRTNGLLVGEKQLNTLVLKTVQDEVISKYQFSYSDAINRLTLDSVGMYSATDESYSEYKFDYVDLRLPTSLNGRRGQDHWGYYNGKSQTTLLPEMVRGSHTLGGADRSVDSAFTKAGMLKKITYPTGGNIVFEFENNDYSFSDEQINKVVNKNLNFRIDGVSSGTMHFNIGDLEGTMKINIDLALNGLCSCDEEGNIFCPSYQQSFVKIYKVGNNTPIKMFGWEPSQICNKSNPSYTYSFSIPSGNYYIEAHSFYQDDVTIVTAEWDKYEEISIGIASGLRIKNMIIDDGTGNGKKIINYSYKQFQDSTKSSGYLVTTPKYTFNPTFIGEMFFSHSSTSKIPLGSGSQIVNYTNVTETQTDESGVTHGKTKYTFNHSGDISFFSINDSPLGTIISNDWKRGDAIKKEMINSTESPQFKQMSEFKEYITPGYSDLAYGLDLYTGDYIPPLNPMIDDTYFIYRRLYAYKSNLYKKIIENEKVFVDNGKFLETAIQYYYSDSTHYQLTSKAETNSDGLVRVTNYEYAHEKYAAMADSNMLSQPYSIEVLDPTKTAPNNVLSKNWTLWKPWVIDSNTFWKPCGTWVWDGVGTPTAPVNCEAN
ncbi:MAG: hypothetical protein WC967_14320 [Balneolaceae bacterium]